MKRRTQSIQQSIYSFAAFWSSFLVLFRVQRVCDTVVARNFLSSIRLPFNVPLRSKLPNKEDLASQYSGWNGLHHLNRQDFGT